MGYQCGNYLNDPVNVYALGSHGLLVLMISKLCAFLILVGYNTKNHFLVRNQNHLATGNVVRGMVLPLYSEYINMLLAETLIFGIVDLVDFDQSHRSHLVATIPFQMAVEQCLQVSLAFFLINYGSGVSAVRRALLRGLVWGFCTLAVFAVVLGAAVDYPSNIFPNSPRDRGTLALTLFLVYLGVLLLFYGVLAVSPLDKLYRRPACIFYARFMVGYVALLFVVGVLMNGTDWNFVALNCSCSMSLFVFSGIIQPIITFKTLQLDSQYWQGLCSDENNPLKEIWDQIDLETAATMASNMASIERSKTRKFPLLHFGLIRFEKRMEYVAGGFSRVYFGHIGRTKVALKMLFAIELNPHDVQEFYKEAAVLDVLRHPNVIECLGVCVMPPALVIALEYCKYGSLFEFLYNARPKKKRKKREEQDIRETLGMSMAHSFAPTANPMLASGSGASMSSRRDSRSSQDDSGHSLFSGLLGRPQPQRSRSPNRESSASAVQMGERSDFSRNCSVDSNTSLFSNTARPQLSTAVNQYLNELELEYNNAHAANPTADFSNPAHASNPSQVSNPSASQTGSHVSNPSASQTGSYVSNPSTSSAVMTLLSKMFGFDSRGAYEVDGGHRLSLAGKPAPFNSRAQYLSLEKRLSLVLDALRSVAFLHERGYMHCDIKSLNFLVTENLTLKLADMGEARAVGSAPKRATPPIPARNWVPPEVLAPDATAESYVPPSDVFGLGLVVSEIILLQLPFGDSSLAYTPANWYVELTDNNVRPPLPVSMDPRLKATMEGMWRTEPVDRISCQDAYDAIDDIYAGIEQLGRNRGAGRLESVDTAGGGSTKETSETDARRSSKVMLSHENNKSSSNARASGLGGSSKDNSSSGHSTNSLLSTF